MFINVLYVHISSINIFEHLKCTNIEKNYMNYKFSYSLKQYKKLEVFIFKDKRTQWN